MKARRAWHVVLAGLLCWAATGAAQDRVRERYEDLLTRNPRKGTALRNLYRLHVEALDVDTWLGSLEARMEAAPEDPAAAMLAGLAYQEHGNLEQAFTCFTRAAALAEDDWYPRYCLGETALIQARYAVAIEHLLRAVDRTDVRENLATLYMLLGKAHLRARRIPEARDWFDRWVELAPDDPTVTEQVAELLYDEGETEAAAGYYRRLAEAPERTPFQRVEAAARLAALAEDAGRADEAVVQYRALLGQLGPDSWLYEEIYARLERLFRSADDLDGLEALYRAQAERNPADLRVRLRLAEFLLRADRLAEGLAVLEKAVEAAPLQREPRARLAEGYLRANRPADAIAQWERLVEAEPEAITHRVQLGRAWLQRSDVPDHRRRASNWLAGIAEVDPTDASLALRAAEEMERLGLTEEAGPLYALAASRADGDPRIVDAYGRHLLAAGDREGALRAFREGVAGDQRTPRNLLALADMLAQHGYDTEALAAVREAIALGPTAADTVPDAARALQRAGRIEEALAALDALREALPDGGDRDRATEQWILLLAQTDQLDDAYRTLTASLRDDAGADAEARVLAARMALVLGWIPEARDWLDPLLRAEDAPIRILELGEGIYQALGEMEGALALLEQISRRDLKRRPEVLTRMADTCRQSGDIEGAFQAAAELKALLPGSPRGHQLEAQLHVMLGDFDPAFEAMREAVRLDPRNMGLRIELAGMYRTQLLIPEAIEMYWQVLRLADDVAGRLAVVGPLTELYAAQGRFEVLVERLRALERTARDPMLARLALAAAYQAADDPSAARRELTELAAEGPTDPEVLRRLVGLCRQEGDLDEAARHQRRLIEVEPDPANYLALGNLELERDRRDAALDAWREGKARRLGAPEEGLKADLEWIRHLEWQGFLEEAREAMHEVHRRHPDDWRVVFEAATMALEANDGAQASALFRELARTPDFAPAGGGAGTGASWADAATGRPDVDAGHRFPMAHTLLQQIGVAKNEILTGYGTSGPGMAAGMSPETLSAARAHAVVYLAFLEGLDPDHDAWLRSLREGSRMQRRLLVQIAFALENTEFTRAVSRELVEAYPQDALGRLVLMMPSRAHVQFGMEDEFLEQVDEQLAWFREHQPEYAWFYDWHELRVLTIHARREDRMRDAAERLVRRGRDDPFVLAQSMSLLRSAELYDLYEQCAEGALAYYRRQGDQTPSDQLINTLGQLAQQVLRRDPANPANAWRLFGRYLDLSLPSARSGRGYGQVIGGGGSTPSLQDVGAAPFPQPNRWWEATRLAQLRRMHQNCLDLGLEKELAAFLTERMHRAEGDAHISARLGAAAVAWWNGDQAGARQLLSPVLEQDAAEDELLLIGARVWEQSGDAAGAHAFVRRVQANHGPMHREARLWALRLAMDAGDRPAAMQAATDLAAMRLSPEEMHQVADYQVALGMTEEAERLALRAERLRQSAGAFAHGPVAGTLEAQVERILALDRSGDTERALLLARQLLRRPPGPGVEEEVRHREQLLEFMQRRGEVTRRLREAEAELAGGRPGRGVREEAFWYYWAEHRYPEAIAVWNAMMAGSRDEQAARLWLVRMLSNARAFEAALAPLEDLLRTDPGVLFERAGLAAVILQAYQEAKQPERLEAAIAGIEPEQLMMGRRRFGSNRTQTVLALLQFSRDIVRRDGFPAGISLHSGALAGELLTNQTLRRQFGAQVADCVGQALEALDRKDEALRVYLSCVAGEGVLRELGLEPVPYADRRPLHGLVARGPGVDILILRAIELAASRGRLEAVADAAERRITAAGEEAESFLLWLCAIRLEDRERAAAWQERALAAALPSDGAPATEEDRAVPYLAAAETLKRAGWHQTAVTLLEQGFAAGVFAPAGGLDQLALAYYADACVAAGNPRRARDTLLARLDAEAAAPMTPSRTSSVRAEWMVQIMDRLIALEFFADAMVVGHRVRALPGLADSDPSRRRVEQALETLRREPPDALSGSAAWKDLAAQAREAMRAHPDEPVYWENLHGLLLAGGDSDAAAALREEVRTHAGARGAWRLRLGQAAQAADSPAEAAEDFLAALRLSPVPVVQDRRLAREILGVIAEAGRAEAFLAVIDALDWQALLQGSPTGVGGPAQRLNVIMQLAEDALRRPIENPELAFRLSRHVRRHLRGLPVHVAYSDRLAGVMMRALPGLNPSEEERFAELLALMAAPQVVQTLAPEAATTQGTPCWSLGMSWGADGVAGGLLDLLDAAEAAGQLPDLQRACRQALTDGDPEQAYWACLTAARTRDLAEMDALLPDALAAANRFRGSPDERAFLLCALGRECSRANAHDAALRCYRDALAMGRQSNTEAVATSTTFYLASALIDRGDREAARQILLEPWSARAAALPPARQAGLHMQRAQTLLHLHFYVDAWVQAYEVLDQLADQPQSRQYRETTRFLDLFMESRLNDLRNAGDLLRLISTIENRWGHGPGSPELWRYLQQLYREVGDSQGVQRSLQRQARSNNTPPADS